MLRRETTRETTKRSVNHREKPRNQSPPVGHVGWKNEGKKERKKGRKGSRSMNSSSLGEVPCCDGLARREVGEGRPCGARKRKREREREDQRVKEGGAWLLRVMFGCCRGTSRFITPRVYVALGHDVKRTEGFSP